MAEELGKIERLPVEEFGPGRKLLLVPLIYCPKEPPPDYLELFNKYWEQAEEQIRNLEAKLGQIHRLYHELIPYGGKEGTEDIKELNEKSYLLSRYPQAQPVALYKSSFA